MRTSLACLTLLLAGCAPNRPLDRPIAALRSLEPVVGVLVMAHGGDQEWNSHVAAAVAPLTADFPTSLAYGMADPSTLAAALDSLSDRGVQRVAVVRMFLSGESFADQTKFYLGLSEAPGKLRSDGAARNRPKSASPDQPWYECGHPSRGAARFR